MKHFATATLVFWIMLVALPGAHAADTTCTTVITDTVNGNLIVPAGAQCFLNGTTVSGNVTVEKGAQLLVFSGFDLRQHSGPSVQICVPDRLRRDFRRR
jgi:hypothetical protein